MKTATREKKTSSNGNGNGSIPAAIKERVISPTQITTYMACSLKYFYRYILKIEPDERSVFLAFGSAIHSSLAYFWNSVKDGKKISLEELQKAFLLDWEIQNTTPVNYNGDDPKELEQKGLELLKVYYETQNQAIGDRQQAEVIAVEQGFKVPIVNPISGEVLPNVSLYGRMDLILQGTVVEHKTSSRKPDPAKIAEDVQLSCYALAYLMLYNELPETVRTDTLLKQKKAGIESVSTYRALDDLSRLYDIVSQVVRGIDAQIFYPCYSFQCANCEFNKDNLCKAWGRKK